MRKHWFKLLLLAVALILAVAVWGVLDTLWHSMETFEANSEIGAVTEYFNHFAAGDYETAAQTSDFTFGEKNSKEDYIRYLKDSFGSDFSDLRFAGRDGDTPGEKIYRIYSGNKCIGQVRLVPHNGKRNWKVIAMVDYIDPITVTAPASVNVTANGFTLTEGTPSVNPDFEGVKDVFEVPQRLTYTLEGYLYEPQLKGVTRDGVECSLVKDEDGNGTMTVPPSEQQKTEYETVMQDFSKLYACYIAKDSTFARLKAKMDASTPLYQAVRTFSNYWYNTHSGYEFRNWEFTDVECSGDGFFAGTVRFDHIVFWRGEEKNYPSAYRLSFRQVDGKWLLVDMKYL